MTLNEIETAFGQHLLKIEDAPEIAWPNKDFTPSGTYIEFRHLPNEAVDDTVTGGMEFQLGLVLMSVVTKSHEYTTEANTIAQAVKKQFPKGLRLSGLNGSLVINRPVSFGTSFQDGAYFRIPVTASYITEPDYC